MSSSSSPFRKEIPRLDGLKTGSEEKEREEEEEEKGEEGEREEKESMRKGDVAKGNEDKEESILKNYDDSDKERDDSTSTVEGAGVIVVSDGVNNSQLDSSRAAEVLADDDDDNDCRRGEEKTSSEKVIDPAEEKKDIKPSPQPQQQQRPKKRRWSCYNCVVIIMDAGLLLLSLLYPILIKTKPKFTLAEPYENGEAKVSSPPRHVFAHGSPRGFFRHESSPWRNLLVDDVFDGDLATLGRIVAVGEWTLVFYYAPWDAQSVEVRPQYLAAAAAAARSPHLKNVRFAAINCGWRHGTCKLRVTKIKSYPVVYAYDSQSRGFIYKGSHDESGYIAFLNRLLYPYHHLTSAEKLENVIATRDTVVLAFLDASSNLTTTQTMTANTTSNKSNAETPATATNSSSDDDGNRTTLTLRSFYDVALHFSQAQHHLSFQFLLVTSPRLAADLDIGLNQLRVFRSANASTTTFDSFASPSSSSLISLLDAHAAPASVALVSRQGPQSLHHHLVNNLANVSLLLFGPDFRSVDAFNPYYHQFRETAMWFRACDAHYLTAFRHILRSSRERFDAQRFCCDHRNFFDDDDDDGSSSSQSSSSYFGPHLPTTTKNQREICSLKTSPFTTRTYVARNSTSSSSRLFCRSATTSTTTSSNDASRAHRCLHYRQNPALCQNRLTTTNAGVVEDGVLAVAGFAGLSCRTNRTFAFRYVVRRDFPELVRRFQIETEDDDDGASSLVILDGTAETAHVLRRVSKCKELGEFIKNFTARKETPPPFRRQKSDAAEAAMKCLKKSGGGGDDSAVTKSCVYELEWPSLRSFLADGREFLLLFYSRGSCGLCLTFNRYFLRLSKLFRDIPNFRLARINVDDNDLPLNLTVSAVPAIIFFRGFNFSRVFRSSDTRLSLPVLLSFVLRHIEDVDARNKLASRLCDRLCLKNNLEDVRKGAEELRRRKTAIVDQMLYVNECVADVEREMLDHAEECGDNDDDDALLSCKSFLDKLTKRVKGFARRLNVKGQRLELIEKKLKTYSKIEAKLAWVLYKRKL